MTGTRAKTYHDGNARDEILASIRCNLATSIPFDAARRNHHGHAEAAQVVSRVPLTSEQLIETFRKTFESVGGLCSVASDENEAEKKVAEVVKTTGSEKVAISNSELVRRLVKAETHVDVIENASAEFLFDCDIGITSAQWAIAETGTLVLESEKESHRLTSLVPPVHLCILKASSIRQSLGEILELTNRDLSRTITLITGASRTSDIELTLAIGVHGPRELHVIVIEDQ